MKEFIIKKIPFSCFGEDEISELVFRKLLDKEKFFIIFADTKVVFNVIFSEDYRRFVAGKILVPSSRLFKFVVKLLFGVSDICLVKESSTLFKIVKGISDYYYRVAVIVNSEKRASKFKANLRLSFPEMKLNIVGLSKILSKYKHKEKVEMLRKLEPNLAIFDTTSSKIVKFVEKNKDLFGDTSVIMSNRGVQLISGVRNVFGDFFRSVENFFFWIFVISWVVKEKVLMLFSESKREEYVKSYRV